MRATFHSSHVGGDYSRGALSVRVTRQASPHSSPLSRIATFSVPPDFHVHNDSVAAALLTLVGRSHTAIHFNFPISRYCAATLTQYYGLDDIGPCDESLQPRAPGRYLGLNYSGGLDSSAMRALLDAVLGTDLRLIGSQYWRDTHRESIAIRSAQAHAICRTNVRTAGFSGRGRFNNAVPLLFADYLNLSAIATGHTFGDLPLVWRNLRDGSDPEFLRSDAAFTAGGLPEIHIARTCLEPALAKVLVRLHPERVEPALAASGSAGSQKHTAKSLVLRALVRDAGYPLPAALREVTFPQVGAEEGIDGTIHLRSIFNLSRYGTDVAARLVPRITQVDLTPLAGLSFRFYERYNPNLARLIPADIRPAILAVLHRCAVLPFDERDFAELEAVRQFILRVNDHADLTF